MIPPRRCAAQHIITSEMNKFERQGRDSADIKTLPDDVAAEISRMPTEVIDISDAPPIAPPAPLTPDEVRTILMSLLLTMFLAALDQTIVATALPTIGRQFQDVSSLSWVITAYLLASTAVAPVFGTLSDIYGRRVMIIVSLALFVAGSILCAMAPNMHGPDPGAGPAGARRRRHHARGADRDFRCGQPTRARPVSGLFQRRMDGGRIGRTGRRRRVRRASALVADLLDQRAAGGGFAGDAAAEDGQDPGVPPQAQGRLARRRAADGIRRHRACWC